MKKSVTRFLVFALLLTLFVGSACAYTTEEGFELPIVSEPKTLTLWVSGGDVVFKTVPNLGENYYFQEMERRTGVHIEVIHPTAGNEVQELNMMISSNDLPDIISPPFGWSYPTGYDGAVEDGVFMDINAIVEEHCPNYWKALHLSDSIWRGAVTDTGRIVGFWNISANGAQPPFMGEVVRKDWLDELGLELPVTYDDWYNMLVAFKEKKGAEAPMMLYYTGFDPLNVFCGGYGITEKFYQVDGVVKYGPMEPGYKDYITMLAKWYAEGLIDPDFASNKNFLPSQNYTTTEKTGAFYEQYLDLSMLKSRSENPNYNAVAVSTPRVNADDELHVRQTAFEDNSNWIITASCKDPVLAAKWCDYAYTMEGDLLASYGQEGLCWEYNEEGKPEFTEFMYNNPDGLSLAEAYHYYAKLGGPGYYHWDREFAGMPQSDLDAMQTWLKDNDAAYVMSGSLSMNADEATEFANIMTDIETYRSEMVVNFILGVEPIENYDAFVEQIRSMNVERAIELKQASYDRFNAR